MPSSDKVMLRDKRSIREPRWCCANCDIWCSNTWRVCNRENTYLSKIAPAAVLHQTDFSTIIIGIPSPHHGEGSGGGGQSARSLVDDQTANGDYTSTYLRLTRTACSYFSWNGVDYWVNGRAAAALSLSLPTLIKISVQSMCPRTISQNCPPAIRYFEEIDLRLRAGKISSIIRTKMTAPLDCFSNKKRSRFLCLRPIGRRH